MATGNEGSMSEPVSEHPSFCDPRECLVGSAGVAFERHRSAPRSVTLPDDICHTRFVTRVTEALVEPDVRYLEVDVYPGDEDEPTAELRFSNGDLFMMIDFFRSLTEFGKPMEAGYVVKKRE